MRQLNLDLNDGTALRDEGIDAVTREAWARQAREAVIAYIRNKKGQPLLGSDVQRIVRDAGRPEPHHPNAYGALVKGLIQDKLIEPTNMFLPAGHSKAHSRAVRVYLVA